MQQQSRGLIKLVIAIALVGTAATTASSREKRECDTIDAEGATSLVVNWKMTAAQVDVRSARISAAAIADLYYTDSAVICELFYEKRADVGYLDLSAKFRRHRDFKNSDNEWDVTFSQSIPIDLTVDMDACDARFDLGGIHLTNLDMEFGAVSGTIDFSSVNPKRMRSIMIEAGASLLDLINVGNANFDHLRLQGGAASIDLDLRGSYTGESTVTLEVGMGSVDITLPEGLAVRVEPDKSNWFSSFDFDEDKLRRAGRNAWETDNFETAKDRLVIIVEVGMGAVDFRWK